MQKSINPDEGVSGAMLGYRSACSKRQIQSPADPATFESYVELMRQGAAGAARVAAAARILQREAHRTSLTAKAAMGALYKAGEDPFRYINIQFDKKLNTVEAEGERVQASIRHRKELKGEFSGDGKEIMEEEIQKQKEAAAKMAKKKVSKLKAIKEKIKAKLKKAKDFAKKNKKKLIVAGAVVTAAGTASAINQAVKKESGKEIHEQEGGPIAEACLLPDLGPELNLNSLSTALVLTNTRAALAQRAAAAFVSANVVEPKPQRSRNVDRFRDFL